MFTTKCSRYHCDKPEKIGKKLYSSPQFLYAIRTPSSTIFIGHFPIQLFVSWEIDNPVFLFVF